MYTMFLIVILISRFRKVLPASFSSGNSVYNKTKYITKLSQATRNIFIQTAHSPKTCQSMIILNQVHSVFCFIINAVLLKIELHIAEIHLYLISKE